MLTFFNRNWLLLGSAFMISLLATVFIIPTEPQSFMYQVMEWLFLFLIAYGILKLLWLIPFSKKRREQVS